MCIFFLSRNRGLSLGITQICSEKSEITRCYLENCNAGVFEPHADLLHSTRSYNTSSSSSNSYREVRTFSSKAGARSSEEQDDDLEDAFSELELETPLDAVREAGSADESDESMSESELSEGDSIADDVDNDLKTLEIKAYAGEKRSTKTRPTSAITKAILAAPTLQ